SNLILTLPSPFLFIFSFFHLPVQLLDRFAFSSFPPSFLRPHTLFSFPPCVCRLAVIVFVLFQALQPLLIPTDCWTKLSHTSSKRLEAHSHSHPTAHGKKEVERDAGRLYAQGLRQVR